MTPSLHDALEEWESNVQALAVASTFVCSRCITDSELWRAVTTPLEDAACSFCQRLGECVTFEGLESVIAEVVANSHVTVDESGAFHDEGEWSEDVNDIQDIVSELLQDAVDAPVQASLVRYAAERTAVPHGFVKRRDLWASLYEFHESDWLRFLEEARAGAPFGRVRWSV